MLHCQGTICLEYPGDCACLCQPCADVKRAEGQTLCTVCNRTGDLLDGKWVHFDGSFCEVKQNVRV